MIIKSAKNYFCHVLVQVDPCLCNKCSYVSYLSIQWSKMVSPCSSWCLTRLAKQETIPEPFPKINPQGALSRVASLCHSCAAPLNIPKEQVSSQWCPDEGRQTYRFLSDSCANCSSIHSCLLIPHVVINSLFPPLDAKKHYCFEKTACRSLPFYWKFIWLDMPA